MLPDVPDWGRGEGRGTMYTDCTFQTFIMSLLSLLFSCRLEMTEILLKGRKTLTHPSILFSEIPTLVVLEMFKLSYLYSSFALFTSFHK